MAIHRSLHGPPAHASDPRASVRGGADREHAHFRRILYEGKTLVAELPGVAIPLARLRRHGVPIGATTDLVIEGYPRSANSFAVAAFRMAQPRAVRVAHHVHAPAQVIAAVRAGIPAMVLIRDPEEAVLERMLVRPWLDVAQAVRAYLRFYRPLLRYRERFVTGWFPDVTSDFGTVIRRVNDRFHTSFQAFRHIEANVQACFDAMERYWLRRVGPGLEFELRVGRPSQLRDQMKEGLRARYRSVRSEAESARALYERFTGSAS